MLKYCAQDKGARGGRGRGCLRKKRRKKEEKKQKKKKKKKKKQQGKSGGGGRGPGRRGGEG
jgi:hypothetical protein